MKGITVKRLTVPAVMLTAGLLLSACGGGDASPGSAMSDMPGMSSSSSSAPGTTTPDASATGSTSAEHNAADTSFAQQMIEHHRGAVAMAELAASRAGSTDVKGLATTIQGAQQPEIDIMSGWLKAWGEDVPADMSGMDHGSMGGDSAMPGMMTDQQMSELTAANGTAFDRMFLQLMTEHHQGAITMSQQQTTAGQNPEAVALATKIITDQSGEIARMRSMLAAL